jgi:hypothetical protein
VPASSPVSVRVSPPSVTTATLPAPPTSNARLTCARSVLSLGLTVAAWR